MKNSKNNNIILDLVFSFLYLVLVYQTNRTYADVEWVDGSEKVKK